MWDVGIGIWDLGLGEEQQGWESHMWMWEVCAEDWAAWTGSRLEEQEDEGSGARSSGRVLWDTRESSCSSSSSLSPLDQLFGIPLSTGSALWDQPFGISSLGSLSPQAQPFGITHSRNATHCSWFSWRSP